MNSGDPLENRFVFVSPSESDVESGESLFSKIEIPKNTIFALYSGHVMEKKTFWNQFVQWKVENNFKEDDDEVELAKKYL